MTKQTQNNTSASDKFENSEMVEQELSPEDVQRIFAPFGRYGSVARRHIASVEKARNEK